MKIYRRMTDEEKGDNYAPEYDILKGPGDFECMLGEPEDCTWWRDGSEAVERLNKLHEFARNYLICTLHGVEKLYPHEVEKFKEAAKKLGVDE